MPAERESRMDESWRISRDVAIRQRDEARAELQAAQEREKALRELFFQEWSVHTGVHPEDAREAFDSMVEDVLAAQRTEEPRE